MKLHMSTYIFFVAFFSCSAGLVSSPRFRAASILSANRVEGVDDLRPRGWHEHKMLPAFNTSTPGCGVTSQVDKDSELHEQCPDECPYWAQNKLDERHCTFLCVQGDMCAEMNPRRPIAAVVRGQKVCRGPVVAFCEEFNYDGTDTCAKCQRFYRVGEGDGRCHFEYWAVVIVIIAVLVIAVSCLLVWLVDLALRPETNPEGLDEGHDFRTRQKLHTPFMEGDTERHRWPLETNLLEDNVAGPGMVLHFNFQLMVIIWAAAVGILWLLLALIVDMDLLVLGRRPFGSPRENCVVVVWGYETQHRLMWTKVWFLSVVYIGTFIGCLLHGVRQLRIYNRVSANSFTMNDFAAYCTGLPEFVGTDISVEATLKSKFEEVTGESVLGVSVCWNYHVDSDDIIQTLEKQLRSDVTEYSTRRSTCSPAPRDSKGFLRRRLFGFEEWIFAPTEPREANVVQILRDMKSTEHAFVVFETEEARNNAVALSEDTDGFTWTGSENKVQLTTVDCEPETVLFNNFGNSHRWQQAMRLFNGFLCIFLALTIWVILFYAPYSYSIMFFNYANGAMPPFVYAFAFTMVVVVGNAIMYQVCGLISDYIGFKFFAERECCYMILYTIACVLQVALDVVVTYLVAWKILTALGFRTSDGTRLHKIDEFNDRVETYAMQRMLADNAFAYAFPSTFLIPFLIEPFVTIIFPLKFMELIVRSHPEIRGKMAEDALVAMPMDMGRYADIILNILLGIFIFYFPGGHTHFIFLAMAACHIYIYAHDHCKVLTVIPNCTYASKSVDFSAQLMLAPCVSCIVGCLVFKANCHGYGFCLTGWGMTEAALTAGLLHCVVHILLLVFLVPRFAKDVPRSQDGPKFEDIAREYPCSWFNANPIHCLRSQEVHKHETYCMYYEAGREYLLVPNPELQCYYEGVPEASEEYGAFNNLKTATESVKSRLRRGRTSGSDQTVSSEKSLGR